MFDKSYCVYLRIKELEKKFQQTAAYRNMKEILTKKNEQIKDLRKRLQRYNFTSDIITITEIFHKTAISFKSNIVVNLLHYIPFSGMNQMSERLTHRKQMKRSTEGLLMHIKGSEVIFIYKDIHFRKAKDQNMINNNELRFLHSSMPSYVFPHRWNDHYVSATI